MRGAPARGRRAPASDKSGRKPAVSSLSRAIPAITVAVADAIGVRVGELPITPEKVVKALDIAVPSGRITDILNGRRSISADGAVRLGRYFGNRAQFWLDLQSQYDIAVVEHERGTEIAGALGERHSSGAGGKAAFEAIATLGRRSSAARNIAPGEISALEEQRLTARPGQGV